MIEQSRNKSGKFVSKSSQLRQVRAIRLTDNTWNKLGQLAAHRNMTRADYLESVVSCSSGQQLELFGGEKSPSEEVITSQTRKSGTQLAIRLQVSSAALTNWIKAGIMISRSATRDPDGIGWQRVDGTKFYRPVIE